MQDRTDVQGRSVLEFAWHTPYGRVALVALLSVLALTVSACGNSSAGDPGSQGTGGESASATEEGSGQEVEAVTPEDVLSDKERTGAPELREWTEPAPEDYDPSTRELFIGTDTSTCSETPKSVAGDC